MMWSAHFEIPIAPKAKGRPRMRVVNGHAQAYTPKTTRVFESTAAELIAKHSPPTLLVGPVHLGVLFVLPRPKSMCRKKDPDFETTPCAKRPDLDNLTKSLVDSINNSGQVWRDDSQVQHMIVEKVYSEKSGKPRIEVRIQGELS